MPQGKGTYGSQVGRPSKKKYNKGGNVDPFSTRNPVGVPAEQAMDMLEDANMANEGLPTSNAQDRSQASPDAEQYNKGGKVDVTDVVKKAGEWEGFYYPKREEFSDPSKVHQIDVIHAGRKRKKGAVKKLVKKALKGKKK